MPENIAQLELSLIEFKSLKYILSEVGSRAKDGKRTKLVVRIFDIHGRLTKHVQMMQALKTRSDAKDLPVDFLRRPFWQRWGIERRRRGLSKKKKKARQKLVELALSELRATIKHEGPVGLEDYPGAPFRFARSEELHELLEAASHAKSAWAFIFKPNELLADSNTPVASAF